MHVVKRASAIHISLVLTALRHSEAASNNFIRIL